MKYDFSVIVLCYNPDMEKLKNTLYSIMMQQDISMEIVIADDGSKEDYSAELRQYFAERGFDHYKLVMNENNQGTVKNLLSALQVVEGEYTKNISPGDYLYDENTLKSYYTCMKQESLQACLGKPVYYSYEEQKLNLYNRSNPIDLNPYRKKNQKKICRNYFWFRDYALGASLAFETEAARKYTLLISEHVRYAEDTAVICMLAKGERIGLLDQFAVWYEYGLGISTNASLKWNKIIFDENKNVFGMLAERDSKFQKIYRYHFKEKSQNRYWNVMRKCALYPPYIGFVIKSLLGNGFKKEYLQCDKKEIVKIMENK